MNSVITFKKQLKTHLFRLAFVSYLHYLFISFCIVLYLNVSLYVTAVVLFCRQILDK